jgi:glyceraldehyde 3-phosphate dehydrogenase
MNSSEKKVKIQHMKKVAINGFGRMGRLVTRILLLRGKELNLELVHINEMLGTTEMLAYLLEFDSVHGRFPLLVNADKNQLIVDGWSPIKVTNISTP